MRVNPIETIRSVVRLRRFEPDPAKRRLARSASVSDLRSFAKRRLPGGVFDYVDGAAEDERTAARNTGLFEHLGFVPRVLRNVEAIDTTGQVLGHQLPIPLVLAPTGFTRIVHPAGELAVARSTARAGLPYCLSTLSTRSIEDVRAVSDGDLWFQVYVWRDKGLLADLLQRARAADYSTIVITVDTAMLGRRERDVRRGFELPPKIGLDTFVDGMLHPSWTWSFLRSEPIVFANVVSSGVADGSDAVSLAQYVNSLFDPSLSWDDIAWFRERWDGGIVLKGVQSVADAQLAADHGVDAIALSNHGGRQLDGAPAPVELIERVADAVGGRSEIICDGGIRRGSDIVKAVALGADAVMFGRPYLYALGTAGEPGVDHLLAEMASGAERTLALIGKQSLADLGRDDVEWRPPAAPATAPSGHAQDGSSEKRRR